MRSHALETSCRAPTSAQPRTFRIQLLGDPGRARYVVTLDSIPVACGFSPVLKIGQMTLFAGDSTRTGRRHAGNRPRRASGSCNSSDIDGDRRTI